MVILREREKKHRITKCYFCIEYKAFKLVERISSKFKNSLCSTAISRGSFPLLFLMWMSAPFAKSSWATFLLPKFFFSKTNSFDFIVSTKPTFSTQYLNMPRNAMEFLRSHLCYELDSGCLFQTAIVQLCRNLILFRFKFEFNKCNRNKFFHWKLAKFNGNFRKL